MLSLLIMMTPLLANAQSGEWPVYRGDTRLTGHQPMPGKVVRPKIIWTMACRVEEALTVIGEEGADSDQLPEAWEAMFGITPPLRVLTPGGTAVPLPLSPSERVADLLLEVPGLERVVFDDAFSGKPELRGHLFAHDVREPRLLWETDPEADMYMPLVILADADGDDRQEICVATHYRIMVFEAIDGQKKMECRYHRLRNYGFFGAVNIDADKYPEFITISDFACHMDVIDNDGGVLSLLWRTDIEEHIGAQQKSVRVGPDPLFDVNADGDIELVFNLFNDTGDQQWHVVGIDARTGRHEVDLPRRFMLGHADLTGNGSQELLLIETDNIPIPDYGVASIRQSDGTVLGSFEEASFATHEVVEMALTASTGAAQGRRTALSPDVNGDGRPEALVLSRQPDRTTLTAWGVDNGHLVARWSVSGADLTASGVGETDGDRGSEVLVGTRGVSHAPPVECRGVASHQLGRHFLERCDTSPIIVAQPGTRERLVVVETALENVVAFCPSENGSLKVRWQVPGRGMTDSYDPRFGVAAADLLEEPGAEIIVARRSPTGCAQLAVLSSVAGHTLWTHDFPHIPGAPPPWNVGGLVFWQPLHGSQGPAVFVSVRRSTMHSCEGLLLDGKTGRVVWHQRGLEPPVAHDRRGYGGKLVAATDLDADGTDEIICCYPDMAWIADSSSGAIRHMLNTADGTVFGGWTAYATPIVADFMGNGSLQILWGGCTYVTGLLDRELQRLWAGSYANAYGRQDVCIQGMGDFEGSGSMQIVERQSNGRLACLAGATGTERWSIPFGVIRGSIVSCDIDSDGQDEALAVSNQELICVGWGKEEWRIPLPAQGFTPAIGDVDGDGRSEILVALRNGDIVCIGGA